MTPARLRAFGYVRVIPSAPPPKVQEHRISSYCHQQGWTLAGVFRTVRFAALAELVQQVKATDAQRVILVREVAEGLERQDPAVWAAVLGVLTKQGALVVTI